MEYKGVALRHEKKYYISTAAQGQISHRLKHTIKRDENVGEDGVYTVTSLYLEDMYDSSYFEKTAGILTRYKYRIRMYKNDPRKLTLEKKLKYGEYIGKVSCLLSMDEYRAIFSGNKLEILLDSKYGLLHELFVEIRTKRLAPKVVVEYDREVFVAEQGNVRITFDKRLRAGISNLDITKEDVNKISAISEDRIIMEVKYDAYLPSYVRDLLTVPGRDNMSISKYTICADLEKLYGGCFNNGQHTIVPRHI